MKKYELIPTENKLFRIKALINFSDVKCGDLGGFVESEKNLSQLGNCWIYNEAKVYNNARVEDDAVVKECAELSQRVCIYDDVIVDDYAVVRGNINIYNDTHVTGFATLEGNSVLYSGIYE